MGLLSRLFARRHSKAVSSHLPSHLIPAPGHQLKVSVATTDMYAVIDLATDKGDKAALFITRCFDNAVYCDAREWHPASARAVALRIFGPEIGPHKVEQMQSIAGDAVRLGYRAATPLGLDLIFGAKRDNSWQEDLGLLIARARACAEI